MDMVFVCCFFVSVYGTSTLKITKVLSNTSKYDVAKDEYMMIVSLEVVDIFLKTSKILLDTDISK